MNRAVIQVHYFARTAVRGLGSSPVTSAIAVATIGVSLVLVGTFALLVWNMEGLLRRFGDALYVTAYLEDGVEPAHQRSLAVLVSTVEGVGAVRIVSKQEALERFRDGVGRGAALLEGLDENPLPASLELTLDQAHHSAEAYAVVVAALEGV